MPDPPEITIELPVEQEDAVDPEAESALNAEDPEDDGIIEGIVGIGDAELGEDAEDVLASQLRLYNGVVLNVVPTTPKLGSGAVG